MRDLEQAEKDLKKAQAAKDQAWRTWEHCQEVVRAAHERVAALRARARDDAKGGAE